MTMTRSERVEAAARNVYGKNWDNPDSGKRPGEEMKVVWRELARKAIEGAYPELASGTHVLMPREPTDEIIQALRHAVGKERFGDIDAMVFWQEEIVSAYERSKPESE